MRPGQAWGASCDTPPDIVLAGSDHDLALAVAGRSHALIRFLPDAASDVARAVGLRADDEPRGWAVPMDALALDDGRLAVNMVVLGTPPEHITWRTRTFALGEDEAPVLCVVVANGQFHGGHDLVPRGHPADGRAEVHRYRVPRPERRALRRRLATATHLPHPSIQQQRTASATFAASRPVPLELDGVGSGSVRSVTISVVPDAYRLLL